MTSLIQLENVTKTYPSRDGKITAVMNLSFGLNEGEKVGLIGRNGAGKTTTMYLMLNLIEPTSGTVVQGVKSLKTAYLPEENIFPPFLTGLEYISWVSQLRGFQENWEKRLTAFIQSEFLDESVMKRKIGTLSKGNKRRIGLVATLITKADIMFLDEPFTGLDPVQQRILTDLVGQWSAEKNTTFFINSHSMEHVSRICDRVLLINEGKLTKDIKLAEFVREGRALESLFEDATQRQL